MLVGVVHAAPGPVRSPLTSSSGVACDDIIASPTCSTAVVTAAVSRMLKLQMSSRRANVGLIQLVNSVGDCAARLINDVRCARSLASEGEERDTDADTLSNEVWKLIRSVHDNIGLQ